MNFDRQTVKQARAIVVCAACGHVMVWMDTGDPKDHDLACHSCLLRIPDAFVFWKSFAIDMADVPVYSSDAEFAKACGIAL